MFDIFQVCYCYMTTTYLLRVINIYKRERHAYTDTQDYTHARRVGIEYLKYCYEYIGGYIMLQIHL